MNKILCCVLFVMLISCTSIPNIDNTNNNKPVENTVIDMQGNQKDVLINPDLAIQNGNNYKNSIEMNMIYIQGGSFVMGDTIGQLNPLPLHKVTVDGFLIGMTEITQEQYLKVMGTNPSIFNSAVDAKNHPIENITWFDAVVFCNKLSRLEKLQSAYLINGTIITYKPNTNGYRLPTEAEWEFAARGGLEWESQLDDNTMSGSAEASGWGMTNSDRTTHPVALKKPNVLGLYDMAGNVMEWCQDWMGDYSIDDQNNPTGPITGTAKVIRGTTWEGWAPPYFGWESIRIQFTPFFQNPSVGFRIARSIQK